MILAEDGKSLKDSMIKMKSDYKPFDYKVLHKNHSQRYKIKIKIKIHKIKIPYREDSVLINCKFLVYSLNIRDKFLVNNSAS